MKEFQRTERLGAHLQRELADVLREEVKDPRVGLITIQEVRVTRDLSQAKVYFTCMGGDAQFTQRLLNRQIAGFLRHELAARVRLRVMPQLQFVYDESIARGEHLADLIEQAVEQESAGKED